MNYSSKALETIFHTLPTYSNAILQYIFKVQWLGGKLLQLLHICEGVTIVLHQAIDCYTGSLTLYNDIWWIFWQKENDIFEMFWYIVENGAFAHNEPMLNFPQCFHKLSTTEKYL